LSLFISSAITIPLDRLGKSMNQLRSLNIKHNSPKRFFDFLVKGQLFSEMKALQKDYYSMKTVVEG
ncbi:MAG: hypothetical protein ACK4IX_16480, partial [Candidatus Sericytochromatia bacterium]